MELLTTQTQWLAALAGGLLIGCAVVLLFAFNGRIAGVSGIVASLLWERRAGEIGWRAAFACGLVLGALAFALFFGERSIIELQTAWVGMAIAGLLVGFGARLGNGCTSGHGVCGIARMSSRSLAATAVFMATAAATVYVMRHLLGGA